MLIASTHRPIAFRASLAGLALVVAFVYWPSMHGAFVFDDFPNILHNPLLQHLKPDWESLRRAFESGFAGPGGRPVAMVSFALNLMTSGTTPFAFKLVNLLIHLTNGLVLFYIARRLVGRFFPDTTGNTRHGLALAVVALWLLHPLQLTAVAYVVQRMTSLAALFSAMAVWRFLRFRDRLLDGPASWWSAGISIAALSLLAIYSKENAALIPLFLAWAEICVYRCHAARPIDRRWLRICTYSILFLFGAAFAVYTFGIDFDAAYSIRPFTLTQRALTELRIVAWYLWMHVFPDIRQMTLFHDGMRVSHSLFAPLSTLWSAGFLVFLAILSWHQRKSRPWITFGVGWFFIGHLLESTIFPLELAYEHRNYFPSFGIFLALTASLWQWADTHRQTRGVATFAVAFLVVLAGATTLRSSQWSGNAGHFLADAVKHPNSPRANLLAAATYSEIAKIPTDPVERARLVKISEQHAVRAEALLPNNPAPYLAHIQVLAEHQMPIDVTLLAATKQRLSEGLLHDATVIRLLIALTRCMVESRCTMAEDHYVELMGAAFTNPRSPSFLAADIARQVADYYATVHHNFDSAARLALRAVELAPHDMSARIDLMAYMIQAGAPQEARIVLNETARLPDARSYGAELRAIEKAIGESQETKIP